jgi:hypothetical protein
MSRFYFPGESAVRINRGEGSTIAYFSVVDMETGVEYRDMRLMEGGRDGHFVKGPYRQYTVNGETKPRFSDYVRAAYDESAGAWNKAGQKWFAELMKAALAEYNRRLNGNAAPSTPAPAAQSNRPASPAAALAKELDDGDWDLPF